MSRVMCLALALASLTVPRGLQRFKHHMADLRHWLQKKKEIQPSSASCQDHLHRWRVLAYERKSFHVNVRKSAYSMPGVRHDPADSLLWSMSELSLTRRAQGEKPSRSPSLPVQMESNRDPSLYSTASVSRASEPTRFSDIMLLPSRSSRSASIQSNQLLPPPSSSRTQGGSSMPDIWQPPPQSTPLRLTSYSSDLPMSSVPLHAPRHSAPHVLPERVLGSPRPSPQYSMDRPFSLLQRNTLEQRRGSDTLSVPDSMLWMPIESVESQSMHRRRSVHVAAAAAAAAAAAIPEVPRHKYADVPMSIPQSRERTSAPATLSQSDSASSQMNKSRLLPSQAEMPPEFLSPSSHKSTPVAWKNTLTSRPQPATCALSHDTMPPDTIPPETLPPDVAPPDILSPTCMPPDIMVPGAMPSKLEPASTQSHRAIVPTMPPHNTLAASPMWSCSVPSVNMYRPVPMILPWPAPERAFVIKSFTEVDVKVSLTHGVWASTEKGNHRLDKAWMKSSQRGPIYLFFSVNGSGRFCGLAQMVSGLDYTQSSNIWAEGHRWKGLFHVHWLMTKDVPNSHLRHILLHSTLAGQSRWRFKLACLLAYLTF